MLLPLMQYYDTETKQIVTQTIYQENGVPYLQKGPGGFTEFNPTNSAPELKFKFLNDKAKLPTRNIADDAGLDIYAAEDITIQPINYKGRDEDSLHKIDQARVAVSTGLAVEVPPGLGWFLWDRSSMAFKNGIHRLAGVIDASYRNEVKVVLMNLGNWPYEIKAGDRIAQGILSPIILAKPVQVAELSATKRLGGFGSSGK